MRDGLEPNHLENYSKATINQGSKSFAKAAMLFDLETRRSVTMLYAWCRYCDDVIDGQEMGHGAQAMTAEHKQALLEDLRHETERIYSDEDIRLPAFAALRQVVHKHSIPRQHLLELLEGFAMDASEVRFENLDATLRYCYHVAGVVGVMMARIMGVTDQQVIDRAADLGIAFQLTNIARDVMDDLRIGRCYLPEDGLQRMGLTRETLDPDLHAEQLHALACKLVVLAEGYYDSARIGIAHLPWRCAWAIASALKIYRDIGLKVQTGGPVAWRHRTLVSGRRKAWHLLGGSVLATHAKLRMRSQHTRPRTGLWTRTIDQNYGPGL